MPPNRPVSLAAVTGGTSNGFLAGETDFKANGLISTPGVVWPYGYFGYNWGTAFHPLNQHSHAAPPGGYGDFRSEHAGGAYCATADGSVQFVRDTISPTTTNRWRATRSGGEVASPDR